MYIVYIKERHLFSLVCTFRNAINKFEVKINVPNGALRFREFFTIYECASFIQFTFASIVVIWQ
jgi:hypothetical protein